MRLHSAGTPLRADTIDAPRPAAGQLLLRVRACGVCRTDLHICDGELAGPKLPLVPGHEVVGIVEALGEGATGFAIGERVGVPWLGWTCGACGYCASERENLCAAARFTGHGIDGGYAEWCVADQRYCLRLPDSYDDVAAAPLLCAGLIGYRALGMAGQAARLGIYGFGAAAHIVAQIAVQQGRSVYAFTRAGDAASQRFALELGCRWAGDSDQRPPEALDAALLFAPVGALVPAALAACARGATVVCAGIHMSDIPAFPYSILWGERVVRSVANLTRHDGQQFMECIARHPVRTETHARPLAEANRALDELRRGAFQGAAVLVP